MNFASVFHQTSQQMCYPLNENELMINLKTGYDVDGVYLCFNDPYMANKDGWIYDRIKVITKKKLQHHLWWSVVVQPQFKRAKYYFELISNNQKYYYFEDGFITEDELKNEKKLLQYFIFPWMNKSDINLAPSWPQDIVWYQIFPDRFYRSENSEVDTSLSLWREGSVSNEERFGGNLLGIVDKIPYLKKLGFNGIYLNPIMEAGTNHKYDTKNYHKIDPAFGSNEDFKHLVQIAHKNGIKIMVDAVFNHSGTEFEPWLDVLKNGQNSKFADWFMINNWDNLKSQKYTTDGNYYSFAFTGLMPKLNTNNPEVIEYFCTICRDWILEFDIDAIRFDVGNEISHKFLKVLRENLLTLKPDIYLLGEIWHNSISWLLGDEYDAVMNYPLLSGINDFYINKFKTKHDFECMINHCYTMYMNQTNKILFNLLDSHDTMRLINRVNDLNIFYQQLTILLTVPGSPSIYYGTEIALEGENDPDCRRLIPWSKLDDPNYCFLINQLKNLLSIRHQYLATKSLNFIFSNNYKQDRVIEYIKKAGNQEICVLLNCSDEDVSVNDNDQILFACNYKDGILAKNGTLITVKNN